VEDAVLCIEIAETEELALDEVREDKGPWWGQTPLFLACQYGGYENARRMVEALHQLGKGDWLERPSTAGQSPLWIACAQGHAELVDLLVSEYKANTNVKTLDGRTPLWIACHNGFYEIAVKLVEHEANPRIHANGVAGRPGTLALDVARRTKNPDLITFMQVVTEAIPAEAEDMRFRNNGVVDAATMKRALDEVERNREKRFEIATAEENKRLADLQKKLEAEDKERLMQDEV